MTSKERLATAVQLLDASTDLLAVKDLSGRFVAANRAFARALHSDRARLVGARNEDFFGSDAGADLSACEHLAFLAGEAVERDVEISLDGEPRRLRVVCTPWIEDGACAGLVLACSVEAEPRRDSASDRTLHAYASAIGALAHRFNNALTTVMGLADWHLVAETHDGPLRSDLEKIRTAATQAEQAAREIQQLTRQTAASLIAPAGAPASSSSAASLSPAVAAAILLVDDEPDVRGSLTVMLRTLGRDVHAVGSADEALRWLRTSAPDLVLTDLEMPGMTGPLLAEAVHDRYPAVPVVLMTGWATGSDDLPPHVAAILPTPLRMAQLRQVLDRLLGRAA
jgi:CheY-like chemotaxis protein